jgi:hypothetical protein
MNPTFTTANISGMTVKRLKKELAHRGLLTHGRKPVLRERLQQAIENPQPQPRGKSGLIY